VKDFKMYIPVRDETNYMIKYYQYLFNRYWGDHVKVCFLGYKKPYGNENYAHVVNLDRNTGIGEIEI